jgi:hypothetical protein
MDQPQDTTQQTPTAAVPDAEPNMDNMHAGLVQFLNSKSLEDTDTAVNAIVNDPENKLMTLLKRYLEDIQDEQLKGAIVSYVISRSLKHAEEAIAAALPEDQVETYNELRIKGLGDLEMMLANVYLAENQLNLDYPELLYEGALKTVQEIEKQLEVAQKVEEKVKTLSDEEVEALYKDLEQGIVTKLLEISSDENLK